MRHFLLAGAAILVSFPVLAGGNTGPSNNNGPTTNNITNQGGRGGDGGIGIGGAGGSAIAGANAAAIAGAQANNRNSVRSTNIQGQRQSAAATGGNSQGGSSSLSYNESNSRHYSGSYDVRSVPNVNAPAIWSNNPCVVSFSGGVAVMGFGASVGAGIEDRDCTRRANAQHLVAMGQTEAAREVMCNSTEVREAFARIGRPCAADAPQMRSVSATITTPVVVSASRPAYCENLLARGLVTDECR